MDITAIKNWVQLNFFRRADGTAISTGIPDAFRPVTLNGAGALDNSLFSGIFSALQTFTASLKTVFCYQNNTVQKASVAHNTNTNCAALTINCNAQDLTSAFYLDIFAAGTGRVGNHVYLLQEAYSTVTLTDVSTALFNFTSLTATVTFNTGTGVYTITVNQQNGASEAVTVKVTVLPIFINGAGTAALAAL